MKIQITENDIKNIIKECAKRIIQERFYKGYVQPDGNGMTGGHWGGHDYTKTIKFKPYDLLDNVEFPENDNLDWMNKTYTAELSIDSSYDESTGYGTESCPVTEISDINIEDSFYYDVKNLPYDDTIKENIIDSVEDGLSNYEDLSDDNEYYDPDDKY